MSESQLALLPRPAIQATAPSLHGAFDYDELEQLGLKPEDVLDFSVNGNPHGPAPLVREALARVRLDVYPDREALVLRRALAESLGMSPRAIMVGSGVSELIMLVVLAYAQPGRRVLIFGPTYGEYRRAAGLMDLVVEEWRCEAASNFAVDVEAVLARCTPPHLAFLCNPNNPTGTYLPPDAVSRLADAWPQTLWVIDEAYLAFVPGGRSVLELKRDNVLVLRSMTKDYALAGLRLGYAVGNEAAIAALARVRPPWNVNALAQAAGLAALTDCEHLARSMGLLQQDKHHLVNGLVALGLQVRPSATHFFLVETGDGAATRRALLRQGLLVRDCASFGLPAFVRIAARKRDENLRLITALASSTNSQGTASNTQLR
jgi:histidinol-phosphate aminotransferase